MRSEISLNLEVELNDSNFAHFLDFKELEVADVNGYLVVFEMLIEDVPRRDIYRLT